MARARNIKPGFFRDADLLSLPAFARLLFIGLWTVCDRSGRIEDKPVQIKIDIFPVDAVDVDDLLNQLQKIEVITRYEVDGKRYLQVVNFCKHQNPHRDEKASTIPEPIKHSASTVQALCEPDTSTVVTRLNPSSLNPDPRSLNPDSRILIPDTLTEIPFDAPPAEDAPEHVVKVVKVKPAKIAKQPAPSADTWAAYESAYLARYGAKPVRNATVNGQLANLVNRLGADESPAVAAWYIGHRNQFYVSCGHSVGMLLRDCEKLRTEWATGRQATQTQAIQGDRTQTNLNAFSGLLLEAKQKEFNHAQH